MLKIHPLSGPVAPFHHYTVKENTNKSHHLLYLWQQEKNKSTLTTYYTYDNKKKQIAIEFLLLSM